MKTQYFIDKKGNYIGGFSEGNPMIPQDAIEISHSPCDAILEKWDGEKWIVDIEIKKQRLKAFLKKSRTDYLKSSADYYAPDFPQEILDKRKMVRGEIDEIEACLTIEELNKFNINFDNDNKRN